MYSATILLLNHGAGNFYGLDDYGTASIYFGNAVLGISAISTSSMASQTAKSVCHHLQQTMGPCSLQVSSASNLVSDVYCNGKCLLSKDMSPDQIRAGLYAGSGAFFGEAAFRGVDRKDVSHADPQYSRGGTDLPSTRLAPSKWSCEPVDTSLPAPAAVDARTGYTATIDEHLQTYLGRDSRYASFCKSASSSVRMLGAHVASSRTTARKIGPLRTAKLPVSEALSWITMALRGRPGARLACKLGLLASSTTLLRELRKRTHWALRSPVRYEWAWRKGRRCGTIFVI